MITIILTGCCVSSSISEEAILLEFLLPRLKQDLVGAPIAPGFVKIYDLISHISDIYLAEQKNWKGSHSNAMVCKCVLCVIVSYLFVFFKGD